jgi:uncharacterized protein
VIIDAHCHAGQGDILTDPWNTSAPLSVYLARARRAGIERTVVVPAFHNNYAVANAGLAKIVGGSRGQLIAFAMVHARRDAGRIGAMVGRAVNQWGFRGIKIHGTDALPTREVCETARRYRVPILVDVCGRADVVDMFAPEYRDVTFIIPHFGSFSDDWRAQQRVVDQIARYPNVFADSSGVRRFDYLVEGVKRAGAGKILYGSDGPWLHPGLELHKIRLLGLSPRDEALILGGNAARLLGLSRGVLRSAGSSPNAPLGARSALEI